MGNLNDARYYGQLEQQGAWTQQDPFQANVDQALQAAIEQQMRMSEINHFNNTCYKESPIDSSILLLLDEELELA